MREAGARANASHRKLLEQHRDLRSAQATNPYPPGHRVSGGASRGHAHRDGRLDLVSGIDPLANRRLASQLAPSVSLAQLSLGRRRRYFLEARKYPDECSTTYPTLSPSQISITFTKSSIVPRTFVAHSDSLLKKLSRTLFCSAANRCCRSHRSATGIPCGCLGSRDRSVDPSHRRRCRY